MGHASSHVMVTNDTGLRTPTGRPTAAVADGARIRDQLVCRADNPDHMGLLHAAAREAPAAADSPWPLTEHFDAADC
jgi:hypothetical protein